MNGSNRGTPKAEKPGRLQLAIEEWQRQLIQLREVQQAKNSAGQNPADRDSTAMPGAQSAAA